MTNLYTTFLRSFLMSKHEHTQTPTYQNTREHSFEQSFQQSNKAVALSIQSASNDQQVYIQALSRPVVYLDIYICISGCFLSIIALQSCLFEGTSPFPSTLAAFFTPRGLSTKVFRNYLVFICCVTSFIRYFFSIFSLTCFSPRPDIFYLFHKLTNHLRVITRNAFNLILFLT